MIGLPNVGNTCYASAVIQCLAKCKNFPHTISLSTSSVGRALADILDAVQMERQDVAFASMKALMRILYDDNCFEFGEYFDACEFLLLLFSKFQNFEHDESKLRALVKLTNFKDMPSLCNYAEHVWQHEVSNEPECNKLFYGSSVTQISCGICGESVHSCETFNMFFVPVGKQVCDLFNQENEPRWKCDACGKQCDTTSKCMFPLKAPEVLVVCITRFEYQHGRITKDQRDVIVEREVSIPIYDNQPVHYELCGAVIHLGDAVHGHYIAIIGDVVIDDDVVYHNNKHIVSAMSQAYLLFYNQVKAT